MSEIDKIKVAIVEDNEDIRCLVAKLLNDTPEFECNYVFINGGQAIDELPAYDIDVVLMDINLPDISGIECIKQLKPLMPEARFMIFTVYNDDDNVFEAIRSGATGYLLKATSPIRILEAIKELFNGGSPMNSEIARRLVNIFVKEQNQENEHLISLTKREQEILEKMSKGFLYREIASSLIISKETVKKHIHNIYTKLQVKTRTEALNKVYPRK
jgi:DNA-binding NarL/FixJ family response regulator